MEKRENALGKHSKHGIRLMRVWIAQTIEWFLVAAHLRKAPQIVLSYDRWENLVTEYAHR